MLKRGYLFDSVKYNNSNRQSSMTACLRVALALKPLFIPLLLLVGQKGSVLCIIVL